MFLYVNRILIKKVGEIRNMKKVSETINEKFSNKMGENMLELMKDKCGLKTDENMEILIDEFKDLVTKVDKMEL